MSIESVMTSSHLILCHPLLFLPSIFPSIMVFYKESVLHIRGPKYWSFSFSINLSNEYSGLISFRMDWLDLLIVERLLLNHRRHWDTWPPEEKNSIWVQRWGLITQLLHNRVLLKYKRDRESFWYRHQKGAERVPPHYCQQWGYIFLISYYNESKECLEVVKTLLDPLP